MKKTLLSLLVFAFVAAKAQVTFNDDFENYTAGSALGPQSPTWTTWSGAQGGTDDVNVSSTDAHSGTNSIYFTSTVATGGPSDVILPLGGIHTTGTFVYSHWMKVPTSKKAYLNFQGTNTMGQIYTMNLTFDNAGNLNFDDGKSVTLQTVYPQGAWFEFELQANLNSNEWEVFINNVSKGKFQNSTFAISSIDYYPSDNTNAYWIDDVNYSHTPFVAPALDGALAILGIDNGLVTQTRKPAITVRNLGTTAITSFDVEIVANGNTTSQALTGLNVAPGATYSFDYVNTLTLISGVNTFVGTLKNVNGNANDDFAGDDQKTISFTPIVPGPDKLVIGEEATGTWCQWCPRGAVGLRNMDAKFHGFFQGIAVHNNDPMEVPAYDSALGLIISGYPSGVVDRGADIDPGSFEADFMQRIVLTPVAKIKNGANYNATTGQLDVSLTTTFKSPASGNFKIACVIIEDSVKGTGSGYNQANAYAGGGNGVMGGFELLPSTVPAAQMVYDHVARAVSPNFGGIPNAYPASVAAGESYIHNFSFNIGAFKKDKIHIVGMLMSPDGKIENASSSNIDEAVVNGYVLNTKQVVYAPKHISLYPNPSTGTSNLLIQASVQEKANIKFVDYQGKTYMQKEITLYAGVNNIPVMTNQLAAGLYLVEITMGGQSYSLNFVKQ